MEGSHYQIKLERSINMEELKPCPFCGGKAAIQQDWSPFFTATTYVGCLDCAASATYCEKREDAIEAWNGRAETLQNLDIRI